MAGDHVGREKAPRRSEHNEGACDRAPKPDVVHLIRSVQRLEGYPDCFGRAVAACRLDCPWGVFCGFLTR